MNLTVTANYSHPGRQRIQYVQPGKAHTVELLDAPEGSFIEKLSTVRGGFWDGCSAYQAAIAGEPGPSCRLVRMEA